MIHEIIKFVCAVGALIGGALTVFGLICWFVPADNTDAQALSEGVAIALLVVGVPVLALSLLGLLL